MATNNPDLDRFVELTSDPNRGAKHSAVIDSIAAKSAKRVRVDNQGRPIVTDQGAATTPPAAS